MKQRETQYFIDGQPAEKTDPRLTHEKQKFKKEFLAFVNLFSPAQKKAYCKPTF